MEKKLRKPNNHLALAIIATIVFCLPTGIISIIYSTKVNGLYEDGKYNEALSASKNAKIWGLISIGITFLVVLLYVLILL